MTRARSVLTMAWGAVLALVVAVTALPALADPTFPDRGTRPVVDDAHLLSAQAEADLTAKLETLERTTHHQLVVVTVPSLQGYEIEDYGYQLGRKWGIGRAAQNDGTMLIVAPSERKVRIEVGYGLEPIITDALSSVIIQTKVIPRFKAGDMEGGVVAGADALIEQLSLDAPQAQARAQQAAQTTRHSRRHGGGIAGIVPFIILFVILSSIFRGRRRGGGLGWLPWLLLASSSRRSSWGDGGGSWGGGGGGWSSGGGGGGGFSGGGGSFGGGGASGSW